MLTNGPTDIDDTFYKAMGGDLIFRSVEAVDSPCVTCRHIEMGIGDVIVWLAVVADSLRLLPDPDPGT